MEKVKATVVTKRIKKNILGAKYMLGVAFYDIQRTDSDSNTSEVKVSYINYECLNIGDDILVPMVRESEGLTYDFNHSIEKI